MSQHSTHMPPQTRQKTRTTMMKKSQKELESADGINTNVQMKEQASMFLTMKEYPTLGRPVDLQTLSHILLQFRNATTKMLKILTDGI
jgi:hypothetical protein